MRRGRALARRARIGGRVHDGAMGTESSISPSEDPNWHLWLIDPIPAEAFLVAEKPSFEEYLIVAAGALGSGDDPANAERSYIFNLRSAHQSVMASSVMSGVLVALKEMRHRYSGGRPGLLFYPAEIPEDLGLLQKPFRSAIHKLYRHNIVYNRNYPNPPREGPLARLIHDVGGHGLADVA
jgi:hypothetical protein